MGDKIAHAIVRFIWIALLVGSMIILLGLYLGRLEEPVVWIGWLMMLIFLAVVFMVIDYNAKKENEFLATATPEEIEEAKEIKERQFDEYRKSKGELAKIGFIILTIAWFIFVIVCIFEV